MECEHQLIPVEKKKAVSAGGVIGIVLVLIGIGLLPFSAVPGLLIIIIAIMISFAGRKKTVMVCQKCGSTVSAP